MTTVILPAWETCEAKRQDNQSLTALETLILDQEPIAHDQCKQFRDQLAAVVAEAQKTVRDQWGTSATVQASQMELAAAALQKHNCPTLAASCRITVDLLTRIASPVLAQADIREVPPTYFEEVGLFHEQMELPHASEPFEPDFLVTEDFRYRIACLDEEKREIIEAHTRHDLAGLADAIGDLVWFALGMAQMMRLPFDAIWAEIRRANMAKRRWIEGDPVKPRNGTALEVVKPEGWEPPDIQGVLRQHVKQLRGQNL